MTDKLFISKNYVLGVMKIICLSILFLLAGCFKTKIEITNEYIINDNWTKKNEEALANSITINKMKVKKDSTINPLSDTFSDISEVEILNKLEEDTSFLHYANIKIKQGESYKDKKIYFNRDNGFYWGSKDFFSADRTKTIGNLQRGCWYKFSDLGIINHTTVYIYIDSTDKAHRFDITQTNY